jgi:hypothetical protein
MGEGRKEGEVLIGQLGRQAASGPRKEGKRQAGVGTLGAKKNPAGVSLRGGVSGLDLLTVSG